MLPAHVLRLAVPGISVEVRIRPAQLALASHRARAWEVLPDYLHPECPRSPQDGLVRLRAGPDSVTSMGQKKAR